MSRRFETIYRVKRRDNLGDPEYWNNRLDDVDRRIDANETALQDLDDVAARVEGVALDRINLVVTPLVQETIERVKTIPNLFSATASGTVVIGTGPKMFIVDQTGRSTFAHQGYVRIVPPGDFTRGMLAAVTSYDTATGELDVVVDLAWGSGTFSAWSVAASLPAETVTPEMIGAVTVEQMNDAIAEAKSSDQAFAISMAVAL
jgi:hypothetical protein